MASSLSASRSPSCLNCLRRSFTFSDTAAFASPTRMQWRGKKKVPTITTTPVRLLVDVPRYGRKGAIVSVAPGAMRNVFFRTGQAQYLTLAEKKAIKDQVTDRDRQFGVKPRNGGKSQEDLLLENAGGPASARPSLPVPRIMELLEKYVPFELEYSRPLIQSPPITAEGAANPNAANAALPTSSLAVPLTSRDIAEDVRSRLAVGATVQGDAMAARVQIEPQDIEVVGSAIQETEGVAVSRDEISMAGVHEIVIHVAGSAKMTRKVRVLPGSTPDMYYGQQAAAGAILETGL